MKLFGRKKEPEKQRSIAIMGGGSWETLACSGYTSLDQNPEVVTAVETIAGLVGLMTLQLMENEENGDVRVRNALSNVLDVKPNKYMGRSNFIQWIVRTMFLEGGGNAVVLPVTSNGTLQSLQPIPPAMVAFEPVGLFDYKVVINGKPYNPQNVLHFVLNPDTYYPWKGRGYSIALQDVANNLRQASKTEKGFMSSEWKPSIIVKVDAMTEEFASKEGRARLLDEYIKTSKAGEPWMIPAQQFEIEQVRPLTLSDLALADFVSLDKKTVASIIGVPPFLLGVDTFKRDEWNSFINTTVMKHAKIIEQELTRKVVASTSRYVKFNPRSLYNYDIKELAEVADEQYVRGIMTGNEVRDWLGLSPKDGLDELTILENYIPLDRIGDQNKLSGEGNA